MATAGRAAAGVDVAPSVRSGEVVRVEKRRNPSRDAKDRGIVAPWYTDASDRTKADQHIMAAAKGHNLEGYPDGEYVCEAIGPRIQGNPLELSTPRCVPLLHQQLYTYARVPRDYYGLRAYMEYLGSMYHPGHLAEGIVFHYAEGMAKIRRKDFHYHE